jgi:hypothetical protein
LIFRLTGSGRRRRIAVEANWDMVHREAKHSVAPGKFDGGLTPCELRLATWENGDYR